METCKWRANPSPCPPPRLACPSVRVRGWGVWVQLVFKSSSVSYLLCDLGQDTSLPRVSAFLPAKWSNYMYLSHGFVAEVDGRQRGSCRRTGAQFLWVRFPLLYSSGSQTHVQGTLRQKTVPTGVPPAGPKPCADGKASRNSADFVPFSDPSELSFT